MAKIDQPVISPRSVVSGQAVNVTVTYSTGQADTLRIEPSPGFSCSPPSYSLPVAGAGVVQFALAITRAQDCSVASCRLQFTTTGSEKVDRVEVQ
jgi:hypothetical protein